MLGAGVQPQPSFVTFFRNNKERYAMLGKYRESLFNTFVGTIVCLLIGVFSLTSAPRSIAQSAEAVAFDPTPITLRAEIQMVNFVMPEATMRVVAADQTGYSQEWTVVLGNPDELIASGLNPRSLTLGHGYLIAGNRSSDSNEHRLLAASITRPDGSVWRR